MAASAPTHRLSFTTCVPALFLLAPKRDNNGSTLTDPTGKNYTWDFENRLIQAIVPGTGTVVFKYDPFGRRIQKSGPNGTTNYLYDGVNLLQEVDGGSNVVARYASSKQIDEQLSEFRSSTTSYFEADGLGSTISLSSVTGTIAGTYVYDTFGDLVASTGGTTNLVRYSGREFEAEVGMYNLRSRYYVPATGRFLEEDSVRFRGGVNFYAYVGNNAPTFIDPFGEQGKTWNGTPLQGSQTPMDGSNGPPYNCLAWGLGITNDWVQPQLWFDDPNTIPVRYKCKRVDCNSQARDCGKKHRMNIYEDPFTPWNWHVEH
jgi:RHS repeat-associated protein